MKISENEKKMPLAWKIKKNIRLENCIKPSLSVYSNQFVERRDSRYQIMGRSKVTRWVTFFVAQKMSSGESLLN